MRAYGLGGEPPTGHQLSVADLVTRVAWERTALGPRDGWSPALATTVDTVLAAPLPMALAVGASHTLVYNDAYAAVLGRKHPDAFARRAAEVLAENWDQPGHGDLVARVLTSGEPFFEGDTVLPVRRRGADAPAELVHFSRAYIPVREVDGTVFGVLSIIAETTGVGRALAGVAELTARLSSALGVDDVAREALRHAVERMGADHARVALAEGPALRMARRARIDSGDESLDRLPPVWVRLPPDIALPTAAVTRTGVALWLDGAALEPFSALASEPLAGRRLDAVATVPLHTGPVRGALSLGFETPRTFGAHDRATLTAVGNLIGQALARAQRFDEQRGLAEMLQRSMLPEALPQLPGLGIAARYLPSAPGTSAGGDFYDAFPLSDGRLVLAIGDVVGHGVRAATVMGQVRAALRVLALREADPEAVLSGLDPFVASLGPEVFVTAIVGVLDPATGALRIASAGHHPPVVRRPRPGGGAAADLLDFAPGPPVGIPGPRPTITLTLSRGDALLLFTDGLVEVPGEDPEVGLLALTQALTAQGEPLDARVLCTTLLDQRRAGGDDVALLVVSLNDGHRRSAEIEIGPDAAGPGIARSWVRATLTGWGAEAHLVDDALLCVSELVSNSLLHARTASHVELDLDEQRLLVLVTDTGLHSSPTAQQAEPTAVRGRGLTVVDALAAAWGSEQSSRGTTVWVELGPRDAKTVGDRAAG